MDNSGFDEEVRRHVFDDLAHAMANAMASGQMVVKDSEDSSELILERLRAVTTREELVQFLHTLSQRWDVYTEVFMKYKSEDLILDIHKELNSMAS